VRDLAEVWLRCRRAVAHLEQGLDLARNVGLDGAILDLNLDGKLSFPIADSLSARGIPYVFVTGYNEGFFPAKYRTIPRLGKPIEEVELEQMLLREFSRALSLSPARTLLEWFCLYQACRTTAAYRGSLSRATNRYG
jgi:hypothetical protein